jgi:phosphoribosylanthranilate isomerase
MKIKVCGMRDPQNIDDLSKLKIDFVGFIFYPKSKRYFDSEVRISTPKNIRRVGVFVNEDIDQVVNKAKKHDLNYLQLHGGEGLKYCEELKKETGLKIIKVFSVDESFDFEETEKFEEVSDLFLFDTQTKDYGGSGKKFDWTILKKYQGKTKFFLSGGITSEDVEEITKIRHHSFYGVDINSGFETDYAFKDIPKVKEFVNEIEENFFVDERGYYGTFGGAYVPEMLRPNLDELNSKYLEVLHSESFKTKYLKLLKDYVGRPSPLYFAENLSRKYNTNVFLKREDLNHTGSHKINNTVGQILLAKELGKTRIIAETGAGQHGVATATVCALMNMQCIVYMGEVDMKRQAPNVARMKMLGAQVIPAKSGSRTLKDATNEAIRDWINNPIDTFYIIGSVVGPHPYPDMVSRLQSVISEEIKKQVDEDEKGSKPDYVVACVGGGSNSMGSFYHFLHDRDTKLIAAEAAGKGIDSGETAASTSIGSEGIIHGSRTMLIQTNDGQIVEPYSISAGLDYPGIGPALSNLWEKKRIEVIPVTDDESMEAAMELTKLEGIIPAIESAHALAVLKRYQFKATDKVVFTVSGRGDKDMETYMEYFV